MRFCVVLVTFVAKIVKYLIVAKVRRQNQTPFIWTWCTYRTGQYSVDSHPVAFWQHWLESKLYLRKMFHSCFASTLYILRCSDDRGILTSHSPAAESELRLSAPFCFRACCHLHVQSVWLISFRQQRRPMICIAGKDFGFDNVLLLSGFVRVIVYTMTHAVCLSVSKIRTRNL